MGVTRRVTLAEAARVLGISKEGVRKRVKRGKLRSDKDPDGRVYVYLPFVGDEVPPGPGPGQAAVGELVEEMRERITDLKAQLEAERNAHAETRRIAYTLAQRVPELEAAQEPPQAPETAPEEPTDTNTPPPENEPQRRSWWRRIFGE